MRGPAENNSDAPDKAPSLQDYLGVSIYWFGLSFFWGAMLVMVLPSRAEQLFGMEGKDLALAILISVGAAVAAVTQILAGAMSDIISFRWGRRRPYILVGTLCGTAMLMFFPYAQTLITLLAVYVAVQFLLNIAIGPYQGLVPDRIPFAYYGRASAFMGIWTLLGRIGGPMVAAMLLHQDGGLTLVILAFAVTLNAFMLVNMILVREDVPPRPKQSYAETLRKMVQIPLRPFPNFNWFLGARIGIFMGLYTVLFSLFYFIKYTLGIDDNESANKVIMWFMILSTVTGVIGTIPGGLLADRLSKKSVLYVSNSICALAGFVFLMSGDLTQAYIAVGLFGLGMGAFQAVDWALACNLVPGHARAKYLGVWGMSDTVPQVFAPLIAGPIAMFFNTPEDPGLGYRVLMVLSMSYFIIGTLILIKVRERTSPDEK